MAKKDKSADDKHIGYKDRVSGEGGGYGQTGPSLSDEGGIPEAAPRVQPSEEFSGGHLRSYEAEHHVSPSEREAGEPAEGASGRHSEDGYDADRINAALEGTDQGPGGERRDGAIADELRRRLADDPALDASDVRVEVDHGAVSLAGTVDSREDRRRAEDLVRSVAGVHEIVDALEIRSDRLGPLPRLATTPH